MPAVLGLKAPCSLEVHSFDSQGTRYLDLTKTHPQQILVACAINLTRLAHWIYGDVPAQARSSAFTRLFQVAPA